MKCQAVVKHQCNGLNDEIIGKFIIDINDIEALEKEVKSKEYNPKTPTYYFIEIHRGRHRDKVQRILINSSVKDVFLKDLANGKYDSKVVVTLKRSRKGPCLEESVSEISMVKKMEKFFRELKGFSADGIVGDCYILSWGDQCKYINLRNYNILKEILSS